MRVLYVINAMGRGGAEVQVLELATNLVRRGHSVGVVVLLPFQGFEDELRTAGVETHTLGLRKGQMTAQAVAQLIAIVRRFRPDVVHGHMFAGNIAARIAGVVRRPRPAVVCTAHQAWEVPRRYVAYRVTDALCDVFSFVSKQGLDQHARGHALSARKGIVVPNGVDVAKFTPATAEERARARSALGLGDGPVWLSLGSFRDEAKDYSNLLRAFAALGEPAVLLIAGEGRLLDEKMAEARALGLGSRVSFLGLRADVVRLMHAADAYVMGSAWESLPLVLLEAGASGLPLVATDVGGTRDIVPEGAGFVVPAKDAQALADAMRKVTAMPSKERTCMGARARALVLAGFSIGSVTTRWEEIYARAVS